MRIYAAICSLIEAGAAYFNTATLEQEFENADWESVQAVGYTDDDE